MVRGGGDEPDDGPDNTSLFQAASDFGLKTMAGRVERSGHQVTMPISAEDVVYRRCCTLLSLFVLWGL